MTMSTAAPSVVIRGLLTQVGAKEFAGVGLNVMRQLGVGVQAGTTWAILVYGPNEQRRWASPRDVPTWNNLWGQEVEWKSSYLLLLDAQAMAQTLMNAQRHPYEGMDPLRQLAYFFNEGPRVTVFRGFDRSRLLSLLAEHSLLVTETDD